MEKIMDELEKKDERVAIFKRDRWTCQACGRSVYIHGTPQLAHAIANTRQTERSTAETSRSPTEPEGRHALKCNDKMNIGFNPVESEKLVDRILAQIDRQIKGQVKDGTHKTIQRSFSKLQSIRDSEGSTCADRYTVQRRSECIRLQSFVVY